MEAVDIIDLTKMKINITESDIKAMVLESYRRLMMERTEYGTEYGSIEWSPFEDDDELMERLYESGVIPDDLYNRSFLIQASRDCTNYYDNYNEVPPSSDCGEPSYYGEYDEAVNLINQVKDPNIKQELLNSLQSKCEEIEFGDFQADVPDPDARYETRRDMGVGVIGSNLEEAREYDTWLGHSDIPGSDGRFFNVVFYLDNDGQINYRLNGDSNQKVPEPITTKPGDWLDTQIRDYMKKHLGEIRANLFI